MTDLPRRTEYMELNDLLDRRDLANVKDHDEAGIAESIRRFGFTTQPEIDERTGRLVAGHGRVDQLAAWHDHGDVAHPPEGVIITGDGVWLVPVQRGWSSTDDLEAQAYMVSTNRLTESGGWKLPDLAAQLTEMAQAPAGLPPGFTTEAYDALLAELAPPDFSPTDGADQPHLDRKFHLVCNNCGAAVDPAAAQRVEQ